MAQLSEAVATAQEALPINNPEPEPVQVELPPDEPGAGEPPEKKPDEAAPPAATPKPKGRPTYERIATLANERNALMEQLRMERNRSDQLAGKLKETETELTHGALRNMELHKARLQAETGAARQALKDARATQNDDALADATARLARSESGLADVEAWEARNKPTPAPSAQQSTPQAADATAPPPYQQPPRLDPQTSTWIAENPWFPTDSPDHDPVMHMTAVAYAARVERDLSAAGKQAEVGGAAYWNKINQYMAKEFPDRYETPEGEAAAEAEPAKPTSSPVAPATRSPPPGATARPGSANGKVLANLTGQERQMADSLRNAGALVYPASHPKVVANPQLRGKRMSEDDSYVAYAQSLRKDKAQEALRRSNQ